MFSIKGFSILAMAIVVVVLLRQLLLISEAFKCQELPKEDASTTPQPYDAEELIILERLGEVIHNLSIRAGTVEYGVLRLQALAALHRGVTRMTSFTRKAKTEGSDGNGTASGANRTGNGTPGGALEALVPSKEGDAGKACRRYRWTQLGVDQMTTAGMHAALGSPQAGNQTAGWQLFALGVDIEGAVKRTLIECAQDTSATRESPQKSMFQRGVGDYFEAARFSPHSHLHNEFDFSQLITAIRDVDTPHLIIYGITMCSSAYCIGTLVGYTFFRLVQGIRTRSLSTACPCCVKKKKGQSDADPSSESESEL